MVSVHSGYEITGPYLKSIKSELFEWRSRIEIASIKDNCILSHFESRMIITSQVLDLGENQNHAAE